MEGKPRRLVKNLSAAEWYVWLRVRRSATDGLNLDGIAHSIDDASELKPTDKGTGLGLSQVYGIVQQAGGDVMIDSKTGKGDESDGSPAARRA